MKKKLFLTELLPFKLSYFGQLSGTIGCRVCVINFFQFSMNPFKTLFTCWGLTADMHTAFGYR